jgi:hypothetical protein
MMHSSHGDAMPSPNPLRAASAAAAHYYYSPVDPPTAATAISINSKLRQQQSSYMKKLILACSMICILTAVQYQTGVNLAITMTMNDRQYDLAGMLPELQPPRQNGRLRGNTETDDSVGDSIELDSLDEDEEQDWDDRALPVDDPDEGSVSNDDYVNAIDAFDHQNSTTANSSSSSTSSLRSRQAASPSSLHRNKNNDTLSSCLMVMDDNHRLTEWIAYHYTVMNLRHLVILSDPRSRFSPTDMLAKWKPYVTIEEWTEADYMDASFAKRAKVFLADVNQTDRRVQQSYHMERQSKFIQKCAWHMQDLHKTWVSFHDIDEYYVLNSKLVAEADEKMGEPGSVLNLINSVQEHLEPLDALTVGLPMNEQYSGPCVTTYRVPYGAIESTDEEIRNNVPDFVDPAQFETLRWRHQRRPDGKRSQIGKSLLDVSRVPDLKNMKWADREKTPFSPHRLLPICPPVHYSAQAFVRINHYVGSWEYYTYRVNDGRKGASKNRKAWEIKANLTGGNFGDEARPWVNGFVRLFGETESVRLLANAGLPKNYTAPTDDSEWMGRPKIEKTVRTIKPKKDKRKKKKKKTVKTEETDFADLLEKYPKLSDESSTDTVSSESGTDTISSE